MSFADIVFEPRDRIVAMVHHQGIVFVATERRVYRMREDKLTDTVAFEPVVFRTEPEAP